MAEISTRGADYGWRPDVVEFMASDVIPDAIILQSATVAAQIEGDTPALHVPFIDDDTAQFSAEGEEIPEADPDLSEVLVFTSKITQLLRVTTEQYNQDNTAAELSASVQRAIVKKANQAFLTQPAPVEPAVAPPTGVLNMAGITDGGEIDGNLDGLIDLIAELEGDGANPSHIILDPVGWARLRKLKTGTGAETTLLGAGTSDSVRRLLDLPVLVTPAMTTGSGLVIDKGVIPAAVGPIKVSKSHDVFFTADSVGLRATWRIGWNVVRPGRLGKFTIAE